MKINGENSFFMDKGAKKGEDLTRETKKRILHCIREVNGISRLEIAQKTGISTATVTRGVESLIKEHDLVEERGSEFVPKGRPRKRLSFKGHNKYAIGIDLGTTYIRGVLTDCHTEVIKEVELITEADKGQEHVLSRVIEVYDNLRNTKLIDSAQIKGVGLAVAGLINTEEQKVDYSPAFGWVNVELRKILEERIDLPLHFDNVSRVMALGEQKFGRGRSFSSFLMVNVGYGIGSGLIIDNKLFYGSKGMAGELGHLPVGGDQHIECSCGKRDCLTSYASGDAIAKRAEQRILQGESSSLAQFMEPSKSKITAKLVADAANVGDPLALSVFSTSVNYLGAAIAGMINVLAPEAIFVGGGVAMNGPVFWEPLQLAIKKGILDQSSNCTQILPVTFPGKSAIYGALGLVIASVLDLE